MTSETIRMSQQTVDYLLLVTSMDHPHPFDPKEIGKPSFRVSFCGVPIVADASLPFGHFCREPAE